MAISLYCMYVGFEYNNNNNNSEDDDDDDDDDDDKIH